jgi:hypothetical protein
MCFFGTWRSTRGVSEKIWLGTPKKANRHGEKSFAGKIIDKWEM